MTEFNEFFGDIDNLRIVIARRWAYFFEQTIKRLPVDVVSPEEALVLGDFIQDACATVAYSADRVKSEAWWLVVLKPDTPDTVRLTFSKIARVLEKISMEECSTVFSVRVVGKIEVSQLLKPFLG